MSRDLSEICERLSGIWEGSSVPNDSNRAVTIWKQCEIRFDLISSESTGLVKICGSGVSEWKGSDFKFNLDGVFDLKSFKFKMKKSHLDKETEYSGTVEQNYLGLSGVYDKGKLSLKRKNGIDSDVLDKLNGGWEGESVRESTNSATLWKDVNLKFNSSDLSITGTGNSIWKGEVIPFEVSGYILELRDRNVFAKLKKRHLSEKFKSTSQDYFELQIDTVILRIKGKQDKGIILDLHKPQSNSLAVPHQQVQAQAPAASVLSSKAPVTRAPSSSLSKEQNKEIYKSLLEGIIASGSITSKQEEILARNREQYCISDSDHTQILRSLGFTHSSWAELYNQKESSSEKPCIICFENQINVILLPCAHLALCSRCAKNLMNCPICRESIQSTIVVYSAT
jgi:hypothetical protein